MYYGCGGLEGGVGARVLDYIKIGGVVVGMVVLFHLWVFLLWELL
jgi:hypothetical protein